MDDNLDSLESELKAILRADKLFALLKLGGSKLTEFVNNIPKLASQLNDDTIKPEQKSISINPEETEKSHVLGLRWNHAEGSLLVSRCLDNSDHLIITQRGILSQVSSIFELMSKFHVFDDSSQERLCAVAFLRGKLCSSQSTMLLCIRESPRRPDETIYDSKARGSSLASNCASDG